MTKWETGDVITAARLNEMVDGIGGVLPNKSNI